ncbi:LysR substrate-binding domain-containing protein [Telmatospirillum sp. J64-1]|uniref:LysR substrate-binding domain-containing protein n=1 Tax=Telmatospirillum sp. J64-1 TaxID=2502183 RepID=UPI00115E7BA8|nr:LysR substrate-binding domain-containing protein [Telmatospirillum sp. J64-1]
MTLEQIRIFVAVAERQHMTQAAEALNLTQPAVSTAIQTLESRHGVDLFHRIGRRIELTEAGRLFLEEARAVLARVQAAELALSELGTLARGTLRVQASQTISSYWLPRHLMAFRRCYPRIDIQLAFGNTAQVAKAVLDGAADLGFVEGEVEDAALSRRVVARDRVVLVVGADHPWAERAAVEPKELLEADWVLREAGSGTRSEFEAALEKLGVPFHRLRVSLELPSNEAVRSSVEAGAGATAISELVAASGLRSGALRRVGLDLPERCFSVLHHRERYLSRTAQAFLKMLEEEEGGASAS